GGGHARGRADHPRSRRPPCRREWRRPRAHRDGIPPAADVGRAGGTRAVAGPAAASRLGHDRRAANPHGGHARAAAARQAGRGGRLHRDRPRRGLSLPQARTESAEALMRLATRLFASTSLLVAATVVAVIFIADRVLRQGFEDEVAASLARE